MKRFCGSAFAALIFTTAYTSTADAEVTSVVIESEENAGRYGLFKYKKVGVVVNGTVDRGGTTGTYSVPMEFVYPKNFSSGIGVVDIVNNSAFETYYPGLGPEGAFDLADDYLSELMFRRGTNLVKVQWQKLVVDIGGANPPAGEPRGLAYGVIEEAEDAWTIITDSSDLLRDPSQLGFTHAVDESDAVIGFGYSASGMLLQHHLLVGDNEKANGDLIFDGSIVSTAGGLCRYESNASFIGGEYVPCFALGNTVYPESAGKVMAVDSESELVATPGAFLMRQDTANYRRYEIAGVSHIPASIYPLDFLGATRQNPNSSSPAFAGAYRNMTQWLNYGIEPPENKYLDGEFDPATTFFNIATDADGNSLGGLRLPFMEREIGGKTVGAPAATYVPIEPTADFATNAFVFLGGAIFPFSSETLNERYTKASYIERVSASALALLAERYIPLIDALEYIHDAKGFAKENLGNAPVAAGFEIEEEDELGAAGCSVGGAKGSSSGLLFGLAMLGLVFRRRRSSQA